MTPESILNNVYAIYIYEFYDILFRLVNYRQIYNSLVFFKQKFHK